MNTRSTEMLDTVSRVLRYACAALALLCIVFAIIAFLAWARPITHAPRNADAVPLRGRYAPHRQ